MNDDIRRRLEAAGERPAGAPDPAFADALEARLLAVAASAPSPAPPRRPRPARLRLALGGTLLALTAVVAVVLAVAFGFGRSVALPELTAPVNVQVALGDGTVLDDPDGLRLPEGAVIRVGSGGSARVGDTVLGPGDVATVEQGRVRVEHDQPRGSVSGSSPAPTLRPTPTPTPTPTRTHAPPARTPSPPASPPPPTAAPTDRPTAAPRRTPSPTHAPVRTPSPTQAPPRETARPTPKPGPAIARPRIRARVLFAPTRIRVTWTATPGAAAYVLVRTGARLGPAPRPRYPGGRIVGSFSRPPATPLGLRVVAGIIEVRLMVVALAPDGTVLSRSRIVTLDTVPPPTAVASAIPTPAPTAGPTAGPIAEPTAIPTPAAGGG